MIYSNIEEFTKAIQTTGILLGIDYGKKKLGIAISNQQQTMSLPIEVIVNQLDLLPPIINKNKAIAIIIGMPINMDGSKGDAASEVEKYAKKIIKLSNLPIYLQDERMTSKAAQMMLKQIGMKREQRDKFDDAIAAALILDTALQLIANSRS